MKNIAMVAWAAAAITSFLLQAEVGATAAVVTAAADSSAPVETIVVTGTKFNTDAAPAKASLDTFEPETIINKSYISNFIQPNASYVTILAIVPGMTGGESNGPGLDDGSAKNTLRGLPDGNFNMTYDGIPFGDTNGPTHHNITYFPTSTIGSIVVDRGPGNAGNIGANTYGGTIKLFSESLSSDRQINAGLAGGSFNTTWENLNLQSGDLPVLGGTRVLVNLQALQSDGALSGQDLFSNNALLKVESRVWRDWTVTLFGDFSFLKEHLSDNNGLTPAQIQVYGKNFSLQKTDPTLPTYYAYNYTSKSADIDYLRQQGSITDFIKIDNMVYTYSYWNHTFSPNSQTQTLPQILAGTSSDNQAITLLNGKKFPNDLLAYDKQNAYRVNGDVFRVAIDYNLAGVKGQIRPGVWWENSETHRFKYYFDANVCNASDINPFHVAGGELGSEIAAANLCGAKKGSAVVPLLGYTKDDEYSSWRQYQPFLEVDIKPTDALTITPGVKYVHWVHSVDAPIAQGSNCGLSLACPPFNNLNQDFRQEFVTNTMLPFATVNYQLAKSWSVYAEYAEGVYVPDISSFETNPPTGVFPKAEKTKNYQLGTVFYADNFTFDADVYYIGIDNNYVSAPCSYSIQETCYINNGKAIYKGLEGEGTYAFDRLFGVDVTGLSVFLNGAAMSSKASGGKWQPNAPHWTAAVGILYQHDGWKISVVDKSVGYMFNDVSNIGFYKLPAYSVVNATVGHDFGTYEVSVSADNILDSRKAIKISEGGTGTSVATSTDQYLFQSPASVMLTLKAHF